MKTKIILAILILFFIFISGCTPFMSKCERNYDLIHGKVFNDSNPENLELIQRYNIIGDCLDGSKVEKIPMVVPMQGCEELQL